MEKFTMKKALVTGGWGFIGSALVRKLLEMGVEVTVLSSRPPNKFYQDLMPSVNWLEGQVELIDKLKVVSSVDVVFHLAGRANVRASVEDPMGDYFANFDPTYKMLEWSRLNNVKKFIFTSTVSVCDSKNLLPCTETHIVRPSSPYGAAKASSEAYCSAYARSYGLQTVVARLFNVFGPFATQLFVADVAEKILLNQFPLSLWGGGEQIRDYLFLDDVVDGLILLSTDGAPGEIYNLASGLPIKLSVLARKLAIAMTGKEAEIVNRGNTHCGDILEWYADISKLTNIGFSQKHTLDDGLAKTAKWILDNKNWFLEARRC